jgi:1,5-anhydro-D-fructose reductase (1,5-anhydro-D-mannitol-forming)
MLRVAMLSGWHVHARDYAKQITQIEDTRITAVWDEQPERGRKWAEELGAAFEEDLHTLLKREDVDAVIVDTPTNMHTEVMIAAANAGKHIFTEKVMALTVKECEAIADAVRKAGVKFCISFPHRTLPANLFAKKAVEEKWLGEITLLRVRNAHNGAVADWLPPHFYDPVACGGGAMIDLGAHPMYLSRWLLGKPRNISSVFNSYTDKSVEDNAVSVIEYENNAIAIVETGFVSPGSPFVMELYGTEGSLFIGGPDQTIKINSKKFAPESDGFVTPEELPAALPSAMLQWVNAIRSGGEIHFGLEEGIQLTELMEGAYKSYRSGCRVNF